MVISRFRGVRRVPRRSKDIAMCAIEQNGAMFKFALAELRDTLG